MKLFVRGHQVHMPVQLALSFTGAGAGFRKEGAVEVETGLSGVADLSC
jgi:hypothetical protein